MCVNLFSWFMCVILLYVNLLIMVVEDLEKIFD